MGGGLQTFSVSLSPLGTNWALVLNETWLGLGLGDFGTKGPGLDNSLGLLKIKRIAWSRVGNGNKT